MIHRLTICCALFQCLRHLTLSLLLVLPVSPRQVCDVSSLESVAAFAADWLASSRPLHLLVNNAGVLVRTRENQGRQRGRPWQ